MAFRYGNREQHMLLPQCIEDYVSDDSVVRAYDAIIEALDFEELGISLDPCRVGNSSYDPKAMLKLLVFGYSYGIRSSRMLERAVYDNLSFIWLIGGLKPDHKTISEFRRKNKSALRKVLKECARICMRLGLIDGNILFVDGTKIKANASAKNTWNREKCEEAIKKLDERIDEILVECDKVDENEEGQGSYIKMNGKTRDSKKLREEIDNIRAELKNSGEKSINTTDPDCARIKSPQGSYAGYNMQVAVDKKHGLIVSGDVVNENNDVNQFTEQVAQANEVLERKCDFACADSGYANTEELKKVEDQGIEVVVPSQRQIAKKNGKKDSNFSKDKFKYDKEADCYICPEGNKLKYTQLKREKKSKVYQILDENVCRKCRNFGICTKSKKGRRVSRLLEEEYLEKLEEKYRSARGQQIYKIRLGRVEAPFGHIKSNLNVGSFLLRGLGKVKAEASILAMCFNIRRMITILGVVGLIQRLMI